MLGLLGRGFFAVVVQTLHGSDTEGKDDLLFGGVGKV